MWAIALALGALLAAEIAIAAGPVAGLAAVSVLSIAVGAGLSAWTLEVAVDSSVLRAGRASIPLAAVGALTPLSAERLRVRAGRDADPAAHLELRPWSHSGLEVEIADPADPTPYLLVGSAEPAALAAAIEARRRAM